MGGGGCKGQLGCDIVAGNFARDYRDFPANRRGILAVGAVGPQGELASYTNRNTPTCPLRKRGPWGAGAHLVPGLRLPYHAGHQPGGSPCGGGSALLPGDPRSAPRGLP